jgi:Zn-dependent protease
MQPLTPEQLAEGFIWFIVFLFSTTCHEAAHALAAKLGGDPTAFHGGQASLNPLPHIRREPFGMVVVPLLSQLLGGWMIGWASAPYDPEWQQRYPRRAAWMALAGPGANFSLLLMAAAGIRAGVAFGLFHAPETATYSLITAPNDAAQWGFAAKLLSVLFIENLLLGTFNLLPLPPLDGSSGITLLMSERMARNFHDWLSEPAFRFAGLLAAWYGFRYVFDFLFTLALNTLYPGAAYG